MDYAALLNLPLEELAQQAYATTRQYFGKAIGLYAPLYLANYCDNHCVYCGFHAKQNIIRNVLSLTEIEQEFQAIRTIGFQSILLLTGESRKHSSPEYIKSAVLLAKKYFTNIALEVYPLEETEYHELYLAGVDGVTIYQETYDRERYKQLHTAGKKSNYDYRYEAPARIARAGIRQISMGALLGLSPWQKDVPALFSHIQQLEKEFPGVEFNLSFPRIRQIDNATNYYLVSDEDMTRILCMARILFPRQGINISTREPAYMRDNLIPLGITKMSAGAITTVGGYADTTSEKEAQFTTSDTRSYTEIKTMLLSKGFDPVLTDWRSIGNESLEAVCQK